MKGLQTEPDFIHWAGRLPKSWKDWPLKFAVDLRNDDPGDNEDLPYVGLENIESATGRVLPMAEEEGVHVPPGGKRFHKGQVLFSKLRPYLAKAFVAEEDGRGTGELLVFEPYLFEPRFLKYCLLSDGFIKTVDASTYGTKMPRAEWGFIGRLRMPLPDANIQQSIADYLDQETARIDELVTEKEKMLALLEEKRNALVTRTVSRGLDPRAETKDSMVEWLGSIPAKWSVMRLKFLATKIGSGKTPLGGAEAYQSEGVPLFRSQNVRFEGLALDDVVFIDADTHEEMTFSKVQSRDVLLNITGASIGRCCVVPPSVVDANVNQHVCIIRTISETLDPYFLNSFLASDLGQRMVFAGEKGISREGLTFEQIANFLVPVPPPDEQQAIVEALNSELSQATELEGALRQSVALLSERRTALITAAVTGQIDVAGVN